MKHFCKHKSTIKGALFLAIQLCFLGGYSVTPAAAQTPAYTSTFTISNESLNYLYPSQQAPNVPSFYKNAKGFPQTMADSIQRFTLSSLKSDNIQNPAVTVSVDGNNATITVSGDSPQIQNYEAIFNKIMGGGDGAANLGYSGTLACQNADFKCWDPNPNADQGNTAPWSFYLPLGLSMVNQQAVMLLNYPPSDALCSTTYTDNFTIHRWTEVLGRVGIENPPLYETIVDIHPIAAPGSDEDQAMTNATPFFFSKSEPSYTAGMLNALLSPQKGSDGERTIPLQVAGVDAHEVWSEFIGEDVYVGDTYLFEREGYPAIPWVATNHPDVTTYQSCPGDDSGGSSNYENDQLVADEIKDLTAACILQKYAENPNISSAQAKSDCEQIWCTEDNGTCNREAVCIQARLDYNFTSPGNCACEAAAVAFCQANQYNACPSTTAVTSCAPYNQACTQPPPSYQSCPKPTG